MQIALLQMPQIQGDLTANTGYVSHALKHLPTQDTTSPRLVLLPEMWNTGFMTSFQEENTSLFDEIYQQGCTALQEWARQYHLAFYTSLIEPSRNGKLRNSALFVSEEGEIIGKYCKHHLFGLGGESKHYEAGRERIQIKWHDWQIRLAICYDLRFPLWLRQDPRQEMYDLLLLTANWPSARIFAWETLLKARAIENQSYVAGVNRIGNGPKNQFYSGGSMILSPKGESLHDEKGADKEGWLLGILSKDELQKQRAYLPVLHEIDKYQLL